MEQNRDRGGEDVTNKKGSRKYHQITGPGPTTSNSGSVIVLEGGERSKVMEEREARSVGSSNGGDSKHDRPR